MCKVRETVPSLPSIFTYQKPPLLQLYMLDGYLKRVRRTVYARRFARFTVGLHIPVGLGAIWSSSARGCFVGNINGVNYSLFTLAVKFAGRLL